MKLGDVLKKERERKKLEPQQIAACLEISLDEYQELEAGNSPAEQWGPRLANIAVALETPTARLIAETAKSTDARRYEGQCGKLIAAKRRAKGMSQGELARNIGISASEIEELERGATPLEAYGPMLLSFAEAISQPIFNLFYPCGLPFQSLQDYP